MNLDTMELVYYNMLEDNECATSEDSGKNNLVSALGELCLVCR